jgi:fumarate hydratase subunit alpha
MKSSEIISRVAEAVVRASTVYTDAHYHKLDEFIAKEDNPNAKWVLEQIVKNAKIAEQERRPLCDDTGTPHLFIELGEGKSLSAELIDAIHTGLAEGLRLLPGRPMAVLGDDIQRIEQSAGLDEDPSALISAPIFIKRVEEEVIRLHVLMQGGGPEIRGKTFRVFHKHSIYALMQEVLSWAGESASLLGCTPCAPAIGIGRSHYEASALMLEAMAYADYAKQSALEQSFTDRLNSCKVGPLGLGGNSTALASFIKIGPQRASGIRVVCMRLCCIVEPRVAFCSI